MPQGEDEAGTGVPAISLRPVWQNIRSDILEGMTMGPFSLPAYIKFLAGVLLLQDATALLLMTAQNTDLNRNGRLVGSLGVLIGVIAALWFCAIASRACRTVRRS